MYGNLDTHILPNPQTQRCPQLYRWENQSSWGLNDLAEAWIFSVLSVQVLKAKIPHYVPQTQVQERINK